MLERRVPTIAKLIVGARRRWDGGLGYFLSLSLVFVVGAAAAQSILPDGRTQTTVSTSGAVTAVRTQTVRNSNAFNSFQRFGVEAGTTANLFLPNGTSNLINIVRDQRTDVYGVLNAIKGGAIGGNVWFATPNGFIVGASGVVNVGSLHVSTPTSAFVNNFFNAPGDPNAAAVTQLLDGTAPRNPDAKITIDGRVNAAEGVSLSAGEINVGGTVYSGARFEGAAPDFSDVVNANGIDSATHVVVREGQIQIVADSDIAVNGTMSAPGGPGIGGGAITIRAGGKVELEAGALIVASGSGEQSSGGNIDIWADRSAVARKGALVDASAGRSGDGGSIEFSAKDSVELAGGEFRADGHDGAAGRVLIDPANITVSDHILRGTSGYTFHQAPPEVDGASVGTSGANLTLLANEAITVNPNVVISSRMVGTPNVVDHVADGNSTGESGDITLAAPSITLKGGSKVLAHGDINHAGGTVTLNAASQPVVSVLGYREATSSIQIGDDSGGATVRGQTIDLRASTEISTKWIYQTSDGGTYIDDPTDVDTAGRTLALGASTGAEAAVGLLATLAGVNIVHSQAVGSASVVVKGGSTIEGTDSVTLRAENTTSAGAAPPTGIGGPGTQVGTPLGLGALYARNKSTATVTVADNAVIKSRKLDVRAHNTAVLEAEIASADAGSGSGDIAIALGVTHADIQASAVIEQGANILVTGGVSVAATNVNTFSTSVEAQTGAGGKAAAAIAVSELSSQATAELRANVRDAATIDVVAINDNQKNATLANSKAGSSLNDMIAAGVKEKLEPLTDPSGALENFLWDKLLGNEEPDAKVKPKSTPFRIGGAIAHATSIADATALIGDGARLHASDHVAVLARTKASDVQISAEASAVSQSRERTGADTARTTFSAGVAIGDYRHDALAKVGRDAVLSAPLLGVAADVVIPVRESILTGGSFDRWSGLATLSSWLDSLTSAFDIFNGLSAASSTSDNSNNSVALSGSVSILSFSHTAQAVLDTDALLNLTGNPAGAWKREYEMVPDDGSTAHSDEQILHEWSFGAPVHVRADRDVTLLFHGGKFLPSDGGAAKGLGMSYTQTDLIGITEAIVREGVAIQGVDETATGPDADGLRTWTSGPGRSMAQAQVTAESSDLLISIAASGGYGGSFGLNGAASIVGITNSTRALVDDEAVLRAEKISLLSKDTPVAWSIAGGFNKSSSSGVGIGIGYNSATTNTYAEIADNDAYQGDLDAARSSLIDVAGSVNVRALAVEARAGGRVETIAVTGAVSSDSDDAGGGFFSNVKNKYDAVQGKLFDLVKKEPGDSISTVSGSSQGTGNDPKNSFGLSAAGSGAINEAELNTTARIEGANIVQGTAPGDNSLLLRGVSDMDVVTASGAAALTRANKSSQTGSAAITGSVAVNVIDNATQAILRDTDVTNAHDTTVQALQGGEQLSVAIGVAIDASNQQSKTKSLSFTGSLSLSFVENDVIATMDGVGLNRQAGIAGRAAEVTAYNRTFIGTGGGSLTAGGKTAAGGALTYSDITNTVNASVTGGSQLLALDSVGIEAYNATEIGAGAAHGAVSTGQNSNALGGAVVITEITNHTTAELSGLSRVAASGQVEVLAKDQGAEVLLEEIIEPDAQRENTVAGLDYCGSSTGVVATPSGNCITSVAGIVQVTPGGGSNNIGLSFNWSQIENRLTAKVVDAAVAANALAVQAESNATITSLAVGVGVADKTSAVGSVAVNKIDNKVDAAVLAPTQNAAYKTVTAATVNVGAKDKSRIDTLGGQVAVSMNGAAVGAAVTYSEIGNEALARVEQMNIHAADSAMFSSGNDARIRSLAVAGSVVAGGSSPAVSASIALNFIGNNTASTVDDSAIDDGAGGTNTVTVRAEDLSVIQSLAGSVSISGSSAAAGGAFAYNKIGNAVTSSLADSTVQQAARLDLLAKQGSTIQNITAAVGGGQTLAISGSVSLNHIGQYGDSGNPDEDGNVTTAEITGSTVSGGATVASVVARDTSKIESLAGAVAISGSSAAVGAAVADNAIRNVAKAGIADSSLLGTTSVALEGKNTSTIDSMSAAGAGGASGAAAGSASSNRTSNRTLAGVTGSTISGSSADVRLSAIDSAAIQSLSGAAAVGGSASVGAAVSVNKINNTTDAHVSGIRPASNGIQASDLRVIADSTAGIKTLAVGLGAGADVGAAGSAAINLIGSNTRSHVDGGARIEASGTVAVIAESDDKIEVAAGAAGIGATAAGIAASTVVNSIDGTTEAFVSGATTEVNARARTGAGIEVDAGSLDGEVDLAGIVGGSTTPIDLIAMRQTETVMGLAVNASATHQVRTTAVNVAAGLYAGVGATANVNVIGGRTQAYVEDARINGGDNAGADSAQRVQVKASDHAYANTFIGGVSGGLAGVGAAADVNVFERNILASVTDSKVDAKGRAEIGAWSTQGVSSLVVGLGAGGFAAVGTGALAKFTSTTDASTQGAALRVGSLDLTADHDTHMFLSAGAVAAGGTAVAGTFAVGLDNSDTRAHIDGGSVDAAGQIDVKADSDTQIKNIGVSGAGAGGAAVAGMAVVALVGNSTQAQITGARIGSAGTPAGGLAVTATDTVEVDNKAGAAAAGGSAGVGLGAGVTKIANTVSATVVDSNVDVSGSVRVEALAQRDLYTFAATAGVSPGFSLAGAAGVTIVGTTLSDEAKNELGSSTDSELDGFAKRDRLSDGGNIDTNDNFSQSDIDAINAKGKTSTSSNLASSSLADGTLAQRTKALVSGGVSTHVRAGGDVKVRATEDDAVAMQVGSVSVGAVALGGSVGFLDISNNVESEVSGAMRLTSTGGTIEVASAVGRLAPGETAASVQTLQGSGGVVGLGAAVSKVNVTNNVAATIARGTTTESLNGDIDVSATDGSDLNAEAVGANIGLLGGAGVTIATAKKQGTTRAALGDAAAAGALTQLTLGNDALRVRSTRSGRVSADATAGAGGILAGSGADSTATDSGVVQALIGHGVAVGSSGATVTVAATATPQTHAQALGVNVGAGAVGASLATARSDATVSAGLGLGASIMAAQLDVLALRSLSGGLPSALANATGASGGLLLGANATLAKAESTGATRASVGEGSSLDVGATTVKADAHSQQTSSGLGFSFGFIALGADYSRAKSETLTEALLGDGVRVSGDSLQVIATGGDTNYAYGLAGSGGVASAPFSEATTTTISKTYARTGNGDNAAADARKIDVGSFELRADHDSRFDSWMDSTNASLFGASGAQATNTADATSEAHIGTGGWVKAQNITMDAHNNVRKSAPTGQIPGLSASVPKWNVNSSSGGLADAPAAGSLTTITTSALTQVGAGAHLEQTGLRDAPGVFALDASNAVTATDKVTMSSGGAVSAASGESIVRAPTNTAKVRVGDFAELFSVGDMVLGARSVADLSTQTAVDVYGLVGVAPAGDSSSSFSSTSNVEIGAATLDSQKDIRLLAGADSSGAANSLRATARTDVFNNTAIPVNRDPVADASIESHSLIDVGNGADLSAVRDVTLFAEKFSATVSGVGIGKDIYREALAAVASGISNAFGGGDVSFETRTGRATKTLTADVVVNGTVLVGRERKLEFEIDAAGVETSKVNGKISSNGIKVVNTVSLSVAGDILDRINDLQDLVKAYTVDSTTADASIAVAAYKSEIAFLGRKLKDMGYPVEEDSATGKLTIVGASSLSAKANIEGVLGESASGSTPGTGMIGTRDGYAEDRTGLVDTNTQLAGNNDGLRADNTRLDTQNAGLSAANTALLATMNNDPDHDAPIQQQINNNDALINGNNATKASNNRTIANNEARIAENGAAIDDLDSRITTLDTQIAQIDTDLKAGVYSDEPSAGPQALFKTLSDGFAPLGNIYVRGDRLQGGGTLNAPGDAEIKITNNSAAFLIINNQSIPPDDGGKIFFNSIDIKRGNAQINEVNGAEAGAAFKILTADSQFNLAGDPVSADKPQIVITSTYDPDDPVHASLKGTDKYQLAPDIVLRGDISNLRGLVKVESESGSIRLENKRDANGNIIPGETANISAGQVDVKTRNGDFVQSYTDTFFHAAGAPLVTVPGSTSSSATFPATLDRIDRNQLLGPGIVANGSVLVAARYLNINGVIQSGIPEWGVSVGNDARLRSSTGTVIGSFADAKLHYDALASKPDGTEFYRVIDDAATGATVTRLGGNQQGAWEPIRVDYNAKEGRLELRNVRVQGGYIELFGEIFNSSASGAKVRVLDGYGQIKVDNQSDLPMWVNLLDTGKGAAGEIRITTIRVDPDTGIATPQPTQVFTRDAAACAVADCDRTGRSFAPQAGLRYVMNVGFDESVEDFYRYYKTGLLGLITTSTGTDRYKISTRTLSNDPIARGESLQVDAQDREARYINGPVAFTSTSVTGGKQQANTLDKTLALGRSWNDCNWWTLCIEATHYQEFTITTGSKTTVTDSVRADYPIGIEFIGFDQGAVNVASNGNLVINGSVNNRDGETGIASTGGSITLRADAGAKLDNLPIVGGSNVRLSAATGIGASDQALLVNVGEGGKLDAVSSAGDVRVSQLTGELRVGTIGGATVDTVVVQADRNLLAFDAASHVQGHRVELQSNHGGIGGLSSAPNDPLIVKSGYTTNTSLWPNNGLMAKAQDSINIKNIADPGHADYSGNLLLIAAESLAGDVHIETTGAVIDNNPFATTDERTQKELAQLWDDLRLRGARAEEKADQAVAAFNNGKNNNYRLYWQLRDRQADPTVYDPAFKYVVTQAERDALLAADPPADISKFEANRTQQYHALHIDLDAPGAFDPKFDYDASKVVVRIDEKTRLPVTQADEIRDGSSWTDAQLALSVGAGLLKNITDTVVTIKEPNAKGRKVTLIAGTDIGSFDAPLNIDLQAQLDLVKEGAPPLTDAQEKQLQAEKAALAAAERGDAQVNGNIVTVVQPRPVNVTTDNIVGTAALTATAGSGFALIGSERDLWIDRVAAVGDIRIKTAGALVNAPTSMGASIIGGSLILEAANGGIGSIADNTPLLVAPAANAGVIARAAGDIWLQTAGDLYADTMFSRSDIRLDAGGSVLDFHGSESRDMPDINLRSNSMTLTALTGSIGSLSNALDVGVNPNGMIAASAGTFGQGIYLNGPFGESFNIASATSGDAVYLSSATQMKISGAVTGPGPISLVSGGLMTLTPFADVHATVLGVYLSAGALTMEDADDGVNAARMRVDAGTIDLQTKGDALITGIETGNPTASAIRVVSTAGRILDNGDTRLDIIADTPPEATLTISGALGIGDDPLDVRLLNLLADSGGVVDLAVQDSVRIGAIVAADRVLLTATGDITGGSISSSGGGAHPDKSISLTSTNGNVNLTSVIGSSDVAVVAQAGAALGSVSSSGGSIDLQSAQGDVLVGSANAAQDVVLSALLGSISVGQSVAGARIDLSANAAVIGASVRSTGAGTGPDKRVSIVSATDRVDVLEVVGTSDVAVAGQTGVVLGSVSSTGGSIDLQSASGNIEVDSTDAAKDVALAATQGSITAGQTRAGGRVEMSAPGAIVGTSVLSTGEGVAITSADESVRFDDVAAAGDVAISGHAGVTLGSVSSGGELLLSSRVGDVSVQQGSADAVSIEAAGSITAGMLSVLSRVQLAGTTVQASVLGGDRAVAGSVTGFDGAMASDVKLTLSGKGGFDLTDFWADTAAVEIPLGAITIDAVRIRDQATFRNPRTLLLIDQDHRNTPPADVQLFSGLAPFELGLEGNQIVTTAFVIRRSPLHEVTTQYGPTISAAEFSEDVLARVQLIPPPDNTPPRVLPKGPLVEFSGVPVSTKGACDPDLNADCGP